MLQAEAVAEILEERDPLRLRSDPRVLKRAVLAYPPKRKKHEGWPQTHEMARRKLCRLLSERYCV